MKISYIFNSHSRVFKFARGHYISTIINNIAQNVQIYVIAYMSKVLIRFIENNNINVKPFHIMYDHKVLQVHRLLHMYDIGGVKSSDLIEMAKQIRDDTFLLRNLSLNLIVSYSTVRAKEAVLLCRKIKSTEVELVNRIIIDLNRNNV